MLTETHSLLVAWFNNMKFHTIVLFVFVALMANFIHTGQGSALSDNGDDISTQEPCLFYNGLSLFSVNEPYKLVEPQNLDSTLDLTSEEMKAKAKSFWARVRSNASELKKKVKAKMSD